MNTPTLIGIAVALGFLAGWRPYLSVLATGLAVHTGVIGGPDAGTLLAALAHPWALGALGIAAIAEGICDKIAWFDSLWDKAHGGIRPAIGALLALGVLDPLGVAGTLGGLILGASTSLMSHGAKAGARAILNASPEPYSNIAISIGEDVLAAGLLFTIFHAPMAAPIVAGLVLMGNLVLTAATRRQLNRMFTPPRKARASSEKRR